MTKAYLNYPNRHITLHGDLRCGEIGKMRKPNQRDVAITQATISQTLAQLSSAQFRLGADASINDVWLSVDFADAEFEEAVVQYVHRLLGQRYSRLDGAKLERHC